MFAMAHARSMWLCALAAASVLSSASFVSVSSPSDVRIRVRVHTHSVPAVRAEAPTAPPLVCPLGSDLDAPQVLLPCPYDCGSSGACVLFPGASQAFCAGDRCVRGDACAIQCTDSAIDTRWTLRVLEGNSSDSIPLDHEESNATVVDGSLVRGLQILDGVAVPPQLREIAIVADVSSERDVSVNATSSFTVPANFFDRVARQATSISLDGVALADQVFSSQPCSPLLNELRITRSGLGECPLEPSQLPNVSRLDLSCNELTSFNGSGFDSLSELSLGHNQITDVPVGSLPVQLEVLNLSSNALTSVPSSVQLLKSLRSLILDNNAIRSVPNAALPSSFAITELSLQNASLTTVPTGLTQLKKLSILRLDYNHLSRITASTFKNLSKSLTVLSLNAAGLQRLPTGLRNHLNLTSLSLALNSLGNGSAIDCSGLPGSLLSLNLSSAGQRALPNGLGNLTKLTSLDLSGNSLQRAVDASTVSPSLIYLNLDNCTLKEAPTKLDKLLKLHILSLRGNPISGKFPVSKLKNVGTLHLDGTGISGLDAFTSASVLNTLSCQNCTKLASLPRLPTSLQTIMVTHAAMTSIGKDTLPARLRSLSITDVEELRTLPEDVFSMTELVDLNLSRCTLTNFTTNGGLQTLQTLSLRNNSLELFSAMLPLIKTLDVRGNRLRSFSVSNATQLTRLDLAHNELDRIPEAIFDLEGLHSLHLEGNPIRGYQPNSTELSFLMKMAFLGMDQEQFSSDCTSPTQLKHFTVCVSGGSDRPRSADTDTPTDSTSKKSSSGITVALDILLILGLVLAVAFIWRRDVKERRERRRNEKEAIYAARSAEMSPSMAHVDVNSLAPYRLDKDAVFKSRRIGSGVFGEVWLAIYGSQRVAIKQLKHEEASPDAVQRFTQEAKLISDLKHPNIVTFVGVMWTELTDLAIVTVFAENGNLRDHLKRLEPPSDGHWDSPKIKIALDIAEALAYLHSLARPVVHRDLQSRNVLLDERFGAKVAGFGVAARGRTGSMSALAGDKLLERVGSVRWLAPELLKGSQYDTSVDVFSLGVILSELDTHGVPYATVQDETGEPLGDDVVKTRVADGSLRLALSLSCPRAIAELALRCSTFEHRDRPRAAEVAAQLQAIHSDIVTEREETGVSL